MSGETKLDSDESTGAASENQPKGDSGADDRADSNAETVDELTSLRQQLTAKELEAKNNYDRYVRQVAEAENFKKRNALARDEAIRFANETLLREILPVLDNLERAIAHAAGGDNGKPLVEGVEMVLKGFLDVLSKFGVSQISAAGQPFDPSKHEAIAQMASDDHESNSVVDELHKGYLFRDRLLRPSLVIVAKPLETKEKKNDGDKVENDPSDD
ncbi:MAG: nucleotide exchange factor GrpE [Deltaproteobacteria bacterium]|nr:nucleotide exchange factor GrpE [Deltaproteobacteria bacterium]